MKNTKISLAVAALVLGQLTGCAAPVLTTSQAARKVEAVTKEQSEKFVVSSLGQSAVKVVDGPSVNFVKKSRGEKRGDLTLKASAAPLGPLLSDLARRSGYSLVFADSVDATRKVTVEFNGTSTEDAIRTAAFLAGYAAVFNKEKRLITVAETATFTFKMPTGAFASLKGNYKAGNSAQGGSGGSGGTGQGSGGGASSNIQSQFSIEGTEGPNGDALVKLITDSAGPQATVSVSPLGYVSVRATAQGLSRVNELMKRLSREAMTQVDIEASVVEVNLTRDFAYGITWDRVIQMASGNSLAVTTAPGDLLGASLTLTRTSASATAIIEALEKFTDVRVVSQPRLVSMNNTPSNFIEATQVPYLGSVQQTPSSVSGGQPTVSGELSFAIDGVTFSAVPSVIDSNQVQITLMPVIDSVGTFAKFDLGTATLEAPRSGKKQSFMRVLAESGKTLILGGIRVATDSTTSTLPAATTGSRGTKEIVILLRANVLEPRQYEPIVAESI